MCAKMKREALKTVKEQRLKTKAGLMNGEENKKIFEGL